MLIKDRNQNVMAGLDIGTSQIRAIVAEPDEHNNLKIIIGSAKSEGVRNGIIVDMEQTVPSIEQAIQECELRCKHAIKSVNVGISNQSIKGIKAHGKVPVGQNQIVSENDIHRLMHETQMSIPYDPDVIHILPQEFFVDGQGGFGDPLGMPGTQVEVNAYTIKCAMDSIQSTIQSCNKARLRVEDIILEPLAAAQAVLSSDDQEQGSILIDLGSGTVDMVLYLEGSIAHAKVLDLGGDHLTNEIATEWKIPWITAETLKRNYGMALASGIEDDSSIELGQTEGQNQGTVSQKKLAQVMEGYFRKVFNQLASDIENTEHKKKIEGGIVFTGGASLTSGITELAQQVFNCPVRLGKPRNIVNQPKLIDSSKYATGIGLLQKGMFAPSYEAFPAISSLTNEE